MTNTEDKFHLSKLRTALIIMGIFWVVAIVLWQTTGKIFYIFNFGYIGTAIGVGGGLYAILPKKKKYQGRRLSQLLVGIYMLVFLGLIKFENMQIEGFFFYLLAGFLVGLLYIIWLLKLPVHYFSIEGGVPGLAGRLWYWIFCHSHETSKGDFQPGGATCAICP